MQAIEVSSVVNNTDTRFTALLSRMLRPDIFLTVGPGFPTTCTNENSFVESQITIIRCIEYEYLLFQWLIG